MSETGRRPLVVGLLSLIAFGLAVTGCRGGGSSGRGGGAAAPTTTLSAATSDALKLWIRNHPLTVTSLLQAAAALEKGARIAPEACQRYKAQVAMARTTVRDAPLPEALSARYLSSALGSFEKGAAACDRAAAAPDVVRQLHRDNVAGLGRIHALISHWSDLGYAG